MKDPLKLSVPRSQQHPRRHAPGCCELPVVGALKPLTESTSVCLFPTSSRCHGRGRGQNLLRGNGQRLRSRVVPESWLLPPVVLLMWYLMHAGQGLAQPQRHAGPALNAVVMLTGQGEGPAKGLRTRLPQLPIFQSKP